MVIFNDGTTPFPTSFSSSSYCADPVIIDALKLQQDKQEIAIVKIQREQDKRFAQDVITEAEYDRLIIIIEGLQKQQDQDQKSSMAADSCCADLQTKLANQNVIMANLQIEQDKKTIANLQIQLNNLREQQANQIVTNANLQIQLNNQIYITDN